MLTFFIILQIILLLFLALHDWVDIPPLTNIKALRAHHSVKALFIQSIVNASFPLIGLFLTIKYLQRPFTTGHVPVWPAIVMVLLYGLLTLGTILSWWVPYFFGSSYKHKAGFQEYKNTHTFLPKRGDNVVPNTLHIIFHVQVWLCLLISIYYLISSIYK